MNFKDVQDRLVLVRKFPENATDKDFEKFFSKVSEVAGVCRSDRLAYILFVSSVDPDQTDALDGIEFLDRKIEVKHAQRFTKDEIDTFKQQTKDGIMSVSGFEMINKDRGVDSKKGRDYSPKEHNERQRHQEESEELRGQDEKRKRDERVDREEKVRKESEKKDPKDDREETEDREEDASPKKEEEVQYNFYSQVHLKSYSKRNEMEKKRSDELLKSSTRAPEKSLKDQSGTVLIRAEFWSIVVGLYIGCQLAQSVLGY